MNPVDEKVQPREQSKARPNEPPHRIKRWGAVIGILVTSVCLGQLCEPAFEVWDDSHPVHSTQLSAPHSSPLKLRKPASGYGTPKLLFITVDGVRPDEFNDCEKLLKRDDYDLTRCSFPKLWQQVKNHRFDVFNMKVGNSRNLSLPGYQSIYGGKSYDKTCQTNTDCTRIPDETWLEQLKRELKLPQTQVAALASWSLLKLALESVEGTIFTNTGQTDFTDPLTGVIPPDLAELNEKMRQNPPSLWEHARLDYFTFPYAVWYLKTHHPQVLSVGFLDSDEWGHLKRFSDYKNQLRTYDGYVDEFLKLIDSSPEYGGNTIVMLTTDHGRGRGLFGKAYSGHGPGLFHRHSSQTWFAISVPEHLKPKFEKLWEEFHLDKKPDQHVIRQLVTRLMLEKDPAFNGNEKQEKPLKTDE